MSQIDSFAIRYSECFDSLKIILENNLEFKRGVFLVENSYISGMDYQIFDNTIKQLARIATAWQESNPLKNYHYNDSDNLHKNLSIYKLLKDTIRLLQKNNSEIVLLPYSYDFVDFMGRTNWSNMFVTKLLSTNRGNCHSLPYLYKILADELNASCWLSLAPNHIYIKNRCKKDGWYNTELTSGNFPTDAWITASGYVPLAAIQNGIYLDTLSNQQAIALCVLDLAKAYEFKTKNYYDGFILKCCNLVLQFHPMNVQAILLQAETLKHIYERQRKNRSSIATETYQKMEELYIKLFDLGYREMPEKMYLQWLKSVIKERNKNF